MTKLLVWPKDKVGTEGWHTIDCKMGWEACGETNRLLKSNVREHRDEVEKIGQGMHFTKWNRKASETERRTI